VIRAAVATPPMNVQRVLAISRPSKTGANPKSSLNVANVRYMRETMPKSDANRSKLIMAGPLPLEAIMLATRHIVKKTMKNYSYRLVTS